MSVTSPINTEPVGPQGARSTSRSAQPLRSPAGWGCCARRCVVVVVAQQHNSGLLWLARRVLVLVAAARDRDAGQTSVIHSSELHRHRAAAGSGGSPLSSAAGEHPGRNFETDN